MKRVFVAIDLPDEVRRIAGRHAARLRQNSPGIRVSWVPPDAMHLTIRFLGNIEEKLLSSLNNCVLRIAGAINPFRLAISEPGVFPNVRRPKVLWLGINDGRDSLAEIKSNLDSHLETLGFERDTRQFRPHLTIARLREPAKSRDLAAQHLETGVDPVDFEVGGITVYESRLGRVRATHLPCVKARFS